MSVKPLKLISEHSLRRRASHTVSTCSAKRENNMTQISQSWMPCFPALKALSLNLEPDRAKGNKWQTLQELHPQQDLQQ